MNTITTTTTTTYGQLKAGDQIVSSDGRGVERVLQVQRKPALGIVSVRTTRVDHHCDPSKPVEVMTSSDDLNVRHGWAAYDAARHNGKQKLLSFNSAHYGVNSHGFQGRCSKTGTTCVGNGAASYEIKSGKSYQALCHGCAKKYNPTHYAELHPDERNASEG